MAEDYFSGREFTCLDAMRNARSKFHDDIVSHAQRHMLATANLGKPSKDAPIALLRSDNAFQLAEFYYLAEEFRLGEPKHIMAFIDQHNQDMEEILDNPAKLKLQGLLPQRIRDALFSSEQKAKVVENAVGGRLRLDQSDIGRFLAPLISPETCRKTLVALSDSGFIERRNIGHVIVVSTGIIEDYYRKHLRYIVNAIGAVSA